MDENFETQSRAILEKAAGIEAPAFLSSRITARHLDALQSRGIRRLQAWKFFALASSSLCAALMVWIGAHRSEVGQRALPELVASVDRAVVVRVELADLNLHPSIVRVRIDLPSGVHFYSEGHAELASSSSVTMNVDPSNPKKYIPFAIRGESLGRKPVMVRFLDERGAVVAERVLDIRFAGGTEHS